MRYNPSDIFTCKNCGQCCKGYGGTFVTELDIETIAAFILEDPERFGSRYCERSCGKWILAQRADGYCVFWDGNCKIHPVKPRMCKAWPFIDSVIHDIDNWHLMANSCPGMRSDIPDHAIQACVKEALRIRAY